MYAETGLALGARQAGQLDLAEKHLLNVLDWHRDQGFESGSSLILAELGFVAELRGDLAKALRLHLQAYAIARETGDPRAIALTLEGLAATQALAGAYPSAARLLGAATQARLSVGRPLPRGQTADIDRITTTTTQALGPDQFTTEFTLGTHTPPDALIPAVTPPNLSDPTTTLA
jgi:tetratricopeptide (TPR) repeat protein